VKLDTPLTATLIIAAICVSVFLLESTHHVTREEFGAQSGMMVEQPWRFLTFEFTHDGINHLVMNLIGLFLAGFLAYELEIRGSAFLAIFLAAGFLSIIPPLVTGAPYLFVGASTGICGLFGAVAVELRRYRLPSVPILLMFFFAISGSPLLESLSGSSAALIETFMHSFGLVLGAGLAFVYEGVSPVNMGNIGIKYRIPGARRTN
jgi:membrane associated rhomboid family serine protease